MYRLQLTLVSCSVRKNAGLAKREVCAECEAGWYRSSSDCVECDVGPFSFCYAILGPVIIFGAAALRTVITTFSTTCFITTIIFMTNTLFNDSTQLSERSRYFRYFSSRFLPSPNELQWRVRRPWHPLLPFS